MTNEEYVPGFKFNSLVKHCESLEDEIKNLRQELRNLNYGSLDNVWYWQGGGEDFIESLTCPVVIPAGDLLDLVRGLNNEPN